MINKFSMTNLRNAEYFQFLSSVCAIFDKYGVDCENLGTYYDELREYRNAAETALAVERTNVKIREKNDMCLYRDKLHSKLFNYLKSILYDEKDARFDDAQKIMKIVKDAGNPSRMAENLESAMLTTLGNKLGPHRVALEAVGATGMLDDLMEANLQFIELEKECRQITAMMKADKSPTMSEIRKQSDPLYRAITGIINGFSKKTEWKEVIGEMNVLVAKYDNLLAARKKTIKN